MTNSTVNRWNVVLIMSGMIAFFMGAGFASGQEILQFFVTYGSQYWIALAAMAFILVWTSISYAKAGYENKFESVKDVYYFYGGKYVGAFFDFFIAVYCYGGFFYMAAAAATVANATFGVPKIVGIVVLGILVILTVIFGFEALAKVMGYSGIMNIILILIITIYTLVTNWQHIPAGIELAASGLSGIERGGFTGIPLLEGPAYLGGTILWYAVFLSELGARRPRPDTKVGVIVGSIVITIMILLSALAMFSVLGEVATVDVPNLTIANRITPAAGIFFTIIILLEVYNTAAPQIWTVAKRISPDETSKKFRIATVVAVILGSIIALLVPFKTLVGTVLAISGYIIFIFYGAVIVKDVRTWLTNRQEGTNRQA